MRYCENTVPKWRYLGKQVKVTRLISMSSTSRSCVLPHFLQLRRGSLEVSSQSLHLDRECH